MTDHERDKWLALFSRYAEGMVDAEELRPLEEALRSDPALRLLFLEYLNLDSALAASAALPEGEVSPAPDEPAPAPSWDHRPASFWNWRAWAAGSVAAALVAAVVLAVVLLLPTPAARAEQTLREARAALHLPVERGYSIELRTDTDPDGVLAPERMRVWTQADRFRVEVEQGDDRWAWGRTPDGVVWVVATRRRGLKIDPDEVGPALQRVCDRYALQPESLLGDILDGAELEQHRSKADGAVLVLRAEFRRGYRRRWLESVELHLDARSKVIRKLTIDRESRTGERESIAFTLVETRPLDESLYALEGNLSEPYEILDRSSKPGRRRMILGNRLGGGNHRWLITGNKK